MPRALKLNILHLLKRILINFIYLTSKALSNETTSSRWRRLFAFLKMFLWLYLLLYFATKFISINFQWKIAREWLDSSLRRFSTTNLCWQVTKLSMASDTIKVSCLLVTSFPISNQRYIYSWRLKSDLCEQVSFTNNQRSKDYSWSILTTYVNRYRTRKKVGHRTVCPFVDNSLSASFYSAPRFTKEIRARKFAWPLSDTQAFIGWDQP